MHAHILVTFYPQAKVPAANVSILCFLSTTVVDKRLPRHAVGIMIIESFKTFWLRSSCYLRMCWSKKWQTWDRLRLHQEHKEKRRKTVINGASEAVVNVGIWVCLNPFCLCHFRVGNVNSLPGEGLKITHPGRGADNPLAPCYLSSRTS